MVANELTIYNAINVSFLATKYSCLVAIIETSFLYVEDRELFTHALCSSRKWYWKIFVAKTLNIRQEVNPSFCFAVLILSHRKTSKWPWPCLKSPYNALQTLGHWLCHVCLCIVLLTCKVPSHQTFILVSGDQKFAFGDSIYHYPLTPFLKNWPLKQVFRGHFGP